MFHWDTMLALSSSGFNGFTEYYLTVLELSIYNDPYFRKEQDKHMVSNTLFHKHNF